MRIEFPFHGATLDDRHGTPTADGLRITVCGNAGYNDVVTVNGAPARRIADRFEAEVVLSSLETDIVANAKGPTGAEQHQVRVVWDKYSRPRYRFSIDDNVFFFRDIAKHGYRSLFDCFYLKLLKDLHDRYGVKFSLNIFFTDGEGFELPHFPDRYRGEWADNADWLKLAFHAYTEFPDRPYMDASAEKLLRDYDLAAEEIHRFAGEATFCPATVIHWGICQPAVFPALAARGITTLSGFFRRHGGQHDVSYLLDADRCEYIANHEALKDFGSGIVFSMVDLVCNCTSVADTTPILERLAAEPRTSRIMDIFTHEQYTWPFYFNYIPDHGQRLETAIRWLTEHGYEPVFFHEGLLGGPSLPA